MAGSGGKTQGTKHEAHDVLSTLYQRLREASDVESLLEAARQQGDQEVLEFLRDYQAAQKDLAERARNLLGVRQVRVQGLPADAMRQSSGQKVESKTDAKRSRRSPGAQTNAQVVSGGHPDDDLVDEQSKESFPASDAPAKY